MLVKSHMRILLFLFLVFSFSVTSCQIADNVVISQRKADDLITRAYEKEGLGFSYPAGWKITRDETYRELGRVVSVEDSKGSILILSLFPLEVPLNLEEYAREVESGFKSRATNGNALDVQKSVIIRDVLLKSTEGVRLKFSFNGIPHTHDLFLVKNKKNIAVFSIQNIDKNWESADKEFQIVLDSLKF